MKLKMKKIIIYGALLFSIASCKKGFLDINENPNSSTSASPELVLPNALNVTAARQINQFTFINAWMGYWCQSGSYAISTTSINDTYQQTTGSGEGLWGNIYNNLEDYNYIEKQANAAGKPFYEAAAKIMKAYDYEQLVDMFGDVPYTEALQGISNVRPKYDDAQTIYESLIAGIDDAIELLQRPDASQSGGNTLVQGYVDKITSSTLSKNDFWIQFGNTLKLRMLVRQSQIPGRESYIQSEIASIIANGRGFIEKDAGVNPGYSNDAAGKQNPFYGFNYNTSLTYTNDFWRANQYSINFLESNGDNRYEDLYSKQTGDATLPSYLGNTLGIPGFVSSKSSAFGPGVLKIAGQSAVILSASESYFLQAEATIRGWLNAGSDDAAQVLYEKGVTASFSSLRNYDIFPLLGRSAPEIEASNLYSSGDPDYDWASATTFDKKLALIIRQKWVAMNMVTPFEAWCDYRRLGLPADMALSQSPYVDVRAIPVRILYPQSEYNTNAANVPVQSVQAHHTDKIFWMP